MSESQFHIMIISACCLLIVISSFTIYLFFYIKRRNNHFFMDKSMMESNFQSSKARETERMMNQISKEIHDNILQSIFALRYQLTTVEKLIGPERHNEQFILLKTMADQIANDATDMSHGLNSDFIKNTNLNFLLESELSRLCTPKNINSQVRVIGNLSNLNSDKKLLIYRIAQDAVQNIVQHSGASDMFIEIENDNSGFRMVIWDNGYGITQNRFHSKNGLGMINMNERAMHLNGQLNINSLPGKGCTITLLLENVNFGNKL